MYINKFYKYHSLGNDFILFDLSEKKDSFIQNILFSATWPEQVRKLCDRHFGVGADGVLLLKVFKDLAEMVIFNSDGSRAEMCMNGCCCAAHFLHFFRKFGNSFILKIGERRVKCSIINENNQMKVLSTYEPADYKEAAKIKTSQGEFFGHIVSVGNPHFVILKRCEISWLSEHGKDLESHEKFPHRTNVEFVWLHSRKGNFGKVYNLLVYERGCGITLACGSGAAAALWALFSLGIIKINESIEFIMPGGNVVSYIDPDKNIVVQARAENVFQGDLSNCRVSKEGVEEKSFCIGN